MISTSESSEISLFSAMEVTQTCWILVFILKPLGNSYKSRKLRRSINNDKNFTNKVWTKQKWLSCKDYEHKLYEKASLKLVIMRKVFGDQKTSFVDRVFCANFDSVSFRKQAVSLRKTAYLGFCFSEVWKQLRHENLRKTTIFHSVRFTKTLN